MPFPLLPVGVILISTFGVIFCPFTPHVVKHLAKTLRSPNPRELNDQIDWDSVRDYSMFSNNNNMQPHHYEDPNDPDEHAYIPHPSRGMQLVAAFRRSCDYANRGTAKGNHYKDNNSTASGTDNHSFTANPNRTSTFQRRNVRSNFLSPAEESYRRSCQKESENNFLSQMD